MGVFPWRTLTNTRQDAHVLVKLGMQPANNQNAKEPEGGWWVFVVPLHPAQIRKMQATHQESLLFTADVSNGSCSHALCCWVEAHATHLQ